MTNSQKNAAKPLKYILFLEVSHMITAKIVKEKFQSIIRHRADNPSSFARHPEKDFTRNRTLTFEKTLSCVVSMDAGSIHRELLRFFKFSSQTPSASALIQQRKKLKINAFENLFHEFNAAFPTKTYKGFHLLACDGSTISVPLEQKKENEEYAYFKNKYWKRESYQLQLNAIYDLLGNRYVDLYMEPRHGHDERKALSSLIERNHLPENSILIADRGYEGFALIAQIEQSNRYYLIRAKDNTQGGIIHGYPLPKEGTYDKTLTYTYTYRQAKEFKMRPDVYKRVHYTPNKYFLNQDRPFYEMTIRFLRIMLPNGTYECLITNLPENKFSAEEIKELYNMRWGIETSFRTLKYTVGLLYFHSKKVELIEQEIWSKLIMYNFFATITFNLPPKKFNGKYTYQPNLTDALHICRNFLRNNEAPPDIETLILLALLPVRPGRKAPRNIRTHESVGLYYRVV